MKQPQTLKEAIEYFSNANTCFEYVVNLRWNDGAVTCPHCHSEFVSVGRVPYFRVNFARSGWSIPYFHKRVFQIRIDSTRKLLTLYRFSV